MMERKEAASYLSATLRSLVPPHVIDRVWDKVVAPLYDDRTRSDTVRTPSSDTDKSVRTQLDTSGRVLSCSECYPDYDPSCSCQQVVA